MTLKGCRKKPIIGIQLLALGDGIEVSTPLMANLYIDTLSHTMYIFYMIVDSHVHSYHASRCRKNS